MNPTLEPGAFLEPFSSDRLRWERDHPSIPLRYFAQNRVLSTFYVPFVPHTPAVTTGILHVAAGAPFIQESLGRRAATLSSVTELIYIFFAIGSMRLLPTTARLSPPFAPARRAHPATSRSRSLPSLSRCCTPPWRPPRAQGRRSRASPGRGPSCGASSGSEAKISAPAAGPERSWRPPDGAVGAIVCGIPTELGGTFNRDRAGGQVKNGRKIFYCRNV